MGTLPAALIVAVLLSLAADVLSEGSLHLNSNKEPTNNKLTKDHMQEGSHSEPESTKNPILDFHPEPRTMNLAMGDLETFMEKVKENMQLDLHREIMAKERSQADEEVVLQEVEQVQYLEISRVEFGMEDESVSCWFFMEPYSLWGKVSSATGRGSVHLYDVNRNVTVSIPDSADVPYKIRAFLYNDDLWAVVLYLERVSTSHYLYVYRYEPQERYLRPWQLIKPKGQADMDLTECNGHPYLFVSVYTSGRGDFGQGTLELYHWRGNVFDSIQSYSTISARSVVSWTMRGDVWTAIAQGSDSRLYHFSKETLFYAQNLETTSAVKVDHFHVEQRHYLVFVGPVQSTIWWWSGEKFLKYQTIDIPNVVDVSTITVADKDPILALFFEDNVKFFMLEGSQFKAQRAHALHRGAALASSMFFRYNGRFFLAVTYDNLAAYIYRLDFRTRTRVIAKTYDPLISGLAKLDQELSSQLTALERLATELERVWRTDVPQNVTAPVVVKGTVTVVSASLDDVTLLSSRPDYTTTAATLSKDLFKLEETVASLNLDSIVFVNQPFEVSGILRFDKPLKANIINLNGIFGDPFIFHVPYSRILDSTLLAKSDLPQVLSEDLHVQLLNARAVNASGTINGIQLERALRRSSGSGQTVRGQVGAVHVTGDVTAGSRINDVEVDQLPFTGIITGTKTFSRVRAKTATIDNLNGIALTKLVDQAISLESPIVEADIEFKDPIDVTGNLVVVGLLGDTVNLTRLLTRTLRPWGNQEVLEPVTFTSAVRVTGDLLSHDINGVDLHRDVLTLSRSQHMTGKLTLEHPVTFLEDLSTGHINGVNLARDAVLLTDSEPSVRGILHLIGHPTASDVWLADGSTVNGRGLQDLVPLWWGEPLFFQEIHVSGEIDLEGTVNRRNLTLLSEEMWRKSQPEVHVTAPLHWNHLTVHGPVKVLGLLTHIDLDRDLIHLTGDETFYNVAFEDDVTIGTLVRQNGARINNVDLVYLNQTGLRRVGSQVLTGHQNLDWIHVEGDVIVKGAVNGLRLSQDVLLADRPQNVTGHITLEHHTTYVQKHVAAPLVVVDGGVNGVHLLEFSRDVVMKDMGGTITGYKEFTGGLTAQELRTDFGTVAGFSLVHPGVLTADTVQHVHPNITFLGHVAFTRPPSVRAINGLNFQDLVSNVLRTDLPQTLSGTLTVHGNVEVYGDVGVSGTVNGLHLPHLESIAMKLDGPNVVSVPLEFQNLTFNELTLGPNATLDGVRMSEMVRVTDAELVMSEVVVPGDIRVIGRLVFGLVNSCNLTKLAEEALYLNSEVPQILQGPVTVATLKVQGPLSNSAQLDSAWQLAKEVTEASRTRVLQGPALFPGNVEADVLKIGSGGRISNLIDDLVLTSVPETWDIYGQKIVGGASVQGELVVKGNLTGQTGGVRLSHLSRDLVRAGQVVEGPLEFSGPVKAKAGVQVDGLLNGLRIPGDLVPTSEFRRIPGELVLKAPARMPGGILVDGDLNGWPLTNLLADRVSLSRGWVTYADVVFHSNVTVFGELQVQGRINDVDPRFALTPHSSGVVQGHKTFLSGLQIQGNLFVGSWNGMDLDFSRAVRLDQATVPGITTFTSPLVAPLLNLTNVNGVNLDELQARLDSVFGDTVLKLESLRSRLDNASVELESLQKSMTKEPEHLGYYQLVQEFSELGLAQNIFLSGEQWGPPQIVIWPAGCRSRSLVYVQDDRSFTLLHDLTLRYLPLGEYVLAYNVSLEGRRCLAVHTTVAPLLKGEIDPTDPGQPLAVGTVFDGSYFTKNGNDYLILASEEGEVSLWLKKSEGWTLHQSLAAPKVSSISLGEGPLLAIASAGPHAVFRWQNGQFQPVVNSRRWRAVAWMGPYLCVLERSRHRMHLDLLSGPGLELVQRLPASGTTLLAPFTLGRELYVIAGGSQTATVLQYRGVEGLAPILLLRTPRLGALKASGPLLAVASARSALLRVAL